MSTVRDWISLVLSLASLALSITIALETIFKRAAVAADLGPEISALGYRSLGVRCVLSNRGAKPATVAGLGAFIDGDPLPFTGRWIVRGTDSFEWRGGAKRIVAGSPYKEFDPILVEPGKAESFVIWFTRRTRWLGTGRIGPHILTVRILKPGGGVWTTESIHFLLGPNDLRCVHDALKAADKTEESEWAECQIESTLAYDMAPVTERN